MASKKATYLNNESNLKKSGRLPRKVIELTCMVTLKQKKQYTATLKHIMSPELDKPDSDSDWAGPHVESADSYSDWLVVLTFDLD